MALTSIKTNFDTQIINPKDSEKKIGNDGLIKTILKRGISWQTPVHGDEVQVHFSGFIENGASLDSTRENGSPFVFKLGQGEVIKGLDEGIATMKKGERAIFKVPPSLGYGQSGSLPSIPSNATLIFDVEMISWSSIRDLTGDGAVLKKITKDGEGWATPKDGDEVLVKYEARTENGEVVSKCEEAAEFHIGDGYVCPALGIAAKTMRKGEQAELAVKPSYGLIEKKNEDGKVGENIPSNSNLTIKLELLSWRSVIDITGDKKVLKKVIKPGEGFERPNEGAQVKVIYSGKLENGTIFESKGTNEEPFQFITFEEQINEGLERAIMTMKKGEHSMVTISAALYLSGHDILVPANSVLLYDVQLIEFTKEKPFWKMDTFEKLEACEKKKNEGNLLFKAGKFWRASKKYEKAANFVEYNHSFTDDQKRQAKDLLASCNLNNAACKLKLGEYNEASRLCTKVLQQDPLNVKALYRRSEAYLKITELDKAKDDIEKALSVDPNNKDVKLKYKLLKDKQREYTKTQAAFFTNMISKMG